MEKKQNIIEKANFQNFLLLAILLCVSTAAHKHWNELILLFFSLPFIKYISPWFFMLAAAALLEWLATFVPRYWRTIRCLKFASLALPDILTAIFLPPLFLSFPFLWQSIWNHHQQDKLQISALSFFAVLALAYFICNTVKTKNQQTAANEDDPKNYLKEDRLNRKKIVEKITETLKKNAENQKSQTIGLYGDWGSGKTTVINFVKDCLEEEEEEEQQQQSLVNKFWIKIKTTIHKFIETRKRKPDKDKFIFFDFSPWFFSSSASIEKAFFTGLKNELQKHYVLPCNFKTAISSFTPLLNGTSGISTCVDRLLDNTDTPQALKDTLENFISRMDCHLVIVADDIDRLDKKEILDIFKLVRLISNFKNTTHILCMDEKSCTHILNGGTPDLNFYWKRYIEKVINKPLMLHQTVQGVIDKRLSELFKQDGIFYLALKQLLSNGDNNYTNIFLKKPNAQIPLIQTSRHANSLFTCLHDNFKDRTKKTNSVEAFFITYLLFNNKNLYKFMQNNRFMFLEPREDWPSTARPFTDLLELVNSESLVILCFMFPVFYEEYKMWFGQGSPYGGNLPPTEQEAWFEQKKNDFANCESVKQNIEEIVDVDFEQTSKLLSYRIKDKIYFPNYFPTEILHTYDFTNIISHNPNPTI